MRIFKISLAFVGLVVGAGFSTGQEIIQYFISFGTQGFWGAVLAGVITVISGGVIIQTGSYFLARDHRPVFKHVSHPIVSSLVDWSITLTLFGIGFVMLAGAGSTLEQQLGLPAWAGAAIMTALVMMTGMLDVDRVSDIISWITPAIVVAVVIAFIYTMFNIPEDFGVINDIALQAASPVQPWWLSAINYSCMALMLGVSMCLVIGGNTPNLRIAGWGGLGGGALFTILLLMMAIILLFNIEQVGDSEVPMLSMFGSMHPMLGLLMVLFIYGMIFNTAIGMFYALGRRLTTRRRSLYKPVFLVTCLVGYAVSFAGFSELLSWVYPAIGYIGIVMIAVLVVWWFRHRGDVRRESQCRDNIRELMARRDDPGQEFTEHDQEQLNRLVGNSSAEPEVITAAIDLELKDSGQRKNITVSAEQGMQ